MSKIQFLRSAPITNCQSSTIARKSPRIIHVSIRSPTKRSVHPLQDKHSINKSTDKIISNRCSPSRKSHRSSAKTTDHSSTDIDRSFQSDQQNRFNNLSAKSKIQKKTDRWANIDQHKKSIDNKKKRKYSTLCLLISLLAALLLAGAIAGSTAAIITSFTTTITTTTNNSSLSTTYTSILTTTNISSTTLTTITSVSTSTISLPTTSFGTSTTSITTSLGTTTTTSTSTTTTTVSSLTSMTASLGTTTTISTSTRTTTTTTSRTTTTTSAPNCFSRIGFDDVVNGSSISGIIPNGYYNLDWTNAQYINASTIPSGGYLTSISYPPFVAHNPNGLPITISSSNGTSFYFNSFNTTAAWRENLQLNIQGYRSSVLSFNFTTSIFASNETIIRCSANACSDLDTLVLTTWGGTIKSGVNGTGIQFIIDDLCLSFGY